MRRTKKRGRNPKRYRYRHIGKRKARLYDRRSIRTIRIGRHGRLMRVGCPKGHWRPRLRRKGRKGRCDRGMQGFEILTPKRRAIRRIYRRHSMRLAANPRLVPQRLNRLTIYRTEDGKYAGTIRDESDRRGKSFLVATANGKYGRVRSRMAALDVIEGELRG